MKNVFILILFCLAFLILLDVAFCTERIDEESKILNSDTTTKAVYDRIDHCVRHVEFFSVLAMDKCTDLMGEKMITPIPVARLPCCSLA